MPLDDRKGILDQIRNPLGFFALALLIIEGSIFGVLAMECEMNAQYQFYTI
uniref:Uncharacterized protein n=1 Tax=Candidatus Kentrum eta TaxID=2126337 RepID=A0A450VMI9_9GAMM|nr:MAG: hypothetical protein BECKH772B_GA0070898_105703 [Candidatus Kentron sp. H]VFK05961.1 MAG: hypothetical protein BECKH772A_GA0070896_106033 [Candidatus Kentron sp. H]VFK09037.1 MAG: hypothetical protein BECKH772C_GA0070978_105723 [Candidatus Kentron sp. H]